MCSIRCSTRANGHSSLSIVRDQPKAVLHASLGAMLSVRRISGAARAVGHTLRLSNRQSRPTVGGAHRSKSPFAAFRMPRMGSFSGLAERRRPPRSCHAGRCGSWGSRQGATAATSSGQGRVESRMTDSATPPGDGRRVRLGRVALRTADAACAGSFAMWLAVMQRRRGQGRSAGPAR